MHKSAFPSFFHVISIIPKQPPPAFLTALDELSKCLETSYPGAHYHTHHVDLQDHATSQLIREAAEILRTNLTKSARKTALPDVVQSLNPTVFIAHGIAIPVLEEALAAVTSNSWAEDKFLPHNVQGFIFHEFTGDDQRNEHIEVYLPDEPERCLTDLGATKVRRHRHHGLATSHNLPFARGRTFWPRMCFRLDQSEIGRPMHSHHCPVKRGSQNAFMLALDIIFACSISSRAPIAVRQSATSPFDQTKGAALSCNLMSCASSARLQVSQYSPSLESRDVILASSQLVWNLVVACILLTWKKSVSKTAAHHHKVKLEGQPETVIPSAVSAAEPVQEFYNHNNWPRIELPPTERTSFKPVKHSTWPVTRYDSLGSRSIQSTTVLTPDVPSKGRIQELMAVWKAYLSNTLAQYRLFLILMSLAWSRNPDTHIVQCPNGTKSGCGTIDDQIGNSQQEHRSNNPSKRPMKDTGSSDNARRKRLDVGIKEPIEAPEDEEFLCPYYNFYPLQHEGCWKKKWRGDDMRKIKDHLYDEHLIIVCNVTDCCLAFRERTDLQAHTHRQNCSRDFSEGYDHFQKDQLKKRTQFRLKKGRQYYEEICKILFPDHSDEVANLDQRPVSRQEHERIVQNCRTEWQNRYRLLYQDIIDTVRVTYDTSELLGTITSVFNNRNPGDTPFIYHDDRANTGARVSTSSAQSAIQGEQANEYNLDYELFECHNDLGQTSVGIESNDDEEDMYDDGGVNLPHLPATPPHQPVPRRTPPLTAWGEDSVLERRDYLNIPQTSGPWDFRQTGRNPPSSPSGFETRSSSSPVLRLCPSSSNQEPANYNPTPISSVYEGEAPDVGFGELLLQEELLAGMDKDKASALDKEKHGEAASEAVKSKPEAGRDLDA